MNDVQHDMPMLAVTMCLAPDRTCSAHQSVVKGLTALEFRDRLRITLWALGDQPAMAKVDVHDFPKAAAQTHCGLLMGRYFREPMDVSLSFYLGGGGGGVMYESGGGILDGDCSYPNARVRNKRGSHLLRWRLPVLCLPHCRHILQPVGKWNREANIQ